MIHTDNDYRHTPLVSVITVLLLFFTQATARAEFDIVDRNKAEEVIQGNKDDIPLLSQETEATVDETHEQVSEKLLTAATWLDSFFDDTRYVAEENRTRAKLKLSAGIERDGSFEFKPRVSLRLHLPHTEGRLNLLISANDDEDFDVDRSANALSSRDDESNLTGAFRYFLRETEKMNISTTAGLSLNYAYAGMRYRRLFDYSSWQGRFTSRLRYYTDDGWESRNQYDIERQVSDRLLFRTTLEANWEEEYNGLPHAVIFSLFQVLKADRAILYDIGNYFQTSPSYQMTDTVFRLRYRQRFYRDWLVFEIAPQVAFPKEYDRDFTPGIIFKLEADFGYTTNREQFDNIFAF
ncbi:MAG: hypothetical protein KKC77_12475 [Proteobacteria bacterium]|nr:hypothetical protein [Pseudomonadota bacterium]